MSTAIPFLIGPEGEKHLLDGEVTTIGRAAENDVVVRDPRASRRHACIRRQGQHLLLEDLGSANGTFLNGERVLAPVKLWDGDRIAVGGATLVFHDPGATFSESPFPDLEVNVAAGLVRVDRRLVALSPKEFALLAYLYERRGQVCSKDEIAAAVWPEYKSAVYDYQVENLVRRLRARLERAPGAPQLIVTVRGLGYKLV